jgi:hypothetical protein
MLIDLDDREDEPQVDGHGLLLGQQLIAHLVDFALREVNRSLIFAHILAEGQVALQVGVDRGLDRLLGQGCHREELVLKLRKLLMKVNTGHGRLLCVHCARKSYTDARFLTSGPRKPPSPYQLR